MARALQQMSIRELAEKVGVSHTAISKYERNIDRPRPAILLKLARVLNVDTNYFLQENPINLESIAYRKHKKLSNKQQTAIEAKIINIIEKQIEFETLLPSNYVKKFQLQKYDIYTYSDIEAVVESVREALEVGYDSIENLTELLELNGIKIVALEAPQGFDGFSAWINGEIPVIISQINIPGDRQRFNLAHELGHLLINNHSSLDEEKVAHRFAGALLMPKSTALYELGYNRTDLSIKELFILKHKYGISMQAIIRRAFDLEIITESSYRRLYIQFSKKGWRKEEAGKPYPVERSHRFTLLVQQALTENLINPSKAAELLGERPNANIQKLNYSSNDLEHIAKEYLVNEELTAFTRDYAEEFYDYE